MAHPVINAEAAHFLYEERRIDPRVVRWCGLTSISEPMPCWRWGKAFYDAPSLLIPYYDVNHNLLSVQGRRLGEAPLPPGGGCCNAAGKSGDLEIPPPGGGGADLEYLSTLIAHPVINAEAAHFLYDERKIDPRVVRWCGLTSIDRPMPCWRWGKAFYDAPSLLIPYRDVDGRLLTVQGRYMGKEEKPRFRFPRGSHVGMYNKPVIKRLRAGDELWITEGPSDCWAMLSAGHKAVAIPSATSLTKADIALLRDGLPEGVSLHMYPDNDEPGMRLFEGLKRWFPELQGHVLPDDYKDFGQWYAAVGLRQPNHGQVS